MKRFIEGENRSQSTLFPEALDDYIAEDNPVRVVDAFANALDYKALGFTRIEPSMTGAPAYHPAALLYKRALTPEMEQDFQVVKQSITKTTE